jgi:hypothetical protein
MTALVVGEWALTSLAVVMGVWAVARKEPATRAFRLSMSFTALMLGLALLLRVTGDIGTAPTSILVVQCLSLANMVACVVLVNLLRPPSPDD